MGELQASRVMVGEEKGRQREQEKPLDVSQLQSTLPSAPELPLVSLRGKAHFDQNFWILFAEVDYLQVNKKMYKSKEQ